MKCCFGFWNSFLTCGAQAILNQQSNLSLFNKIAVSLVLETDLKGLILMAEYESDPWFAQTFQFLKAVPNIEPSHHVQLIHRLWKSFWGGFN